MTATPPTDPRPIFRLEPGERTRLFDPLVGHFLTVVSWAGGDSAWPRHTVGHVVGVARSLTVSADNPLIMRAARTASTELVAISTAEIAFIHRPGSYIDATGEHPVPTGSSAPDEDPS